jgi:hypothetical protein
MARKRNQVGAAEKEMGEMNEDSRPSNLLGLVNQVLQICIDANATSQALASLLTKKGVITDEELRTAIEESQAASGKLATALSSLDSGKNTA